MTALKALGQGFLCGLIRVYQWGISPLLPGTCRFHPTCSAYAIEAVSRHGALRGSWLGLRRLLQCHPWGGSGVDPVPDPPGLRARGRSGHSDHNHA
jgi:hypothetical protein